MEKTYKIIKEANKEDVLTETITFGKTITKTYTKQQIEDEMARLQTLLDQFGEEK